MRILQINTTVNFGSTGRIAEDIGKVLIANGHESYIAYGRGNQTSESKLIKIGTQKDIILHGLKTALVDRHGFGSKEATQKLIAQIEKIQPDSIGLHNIHGYYLNIEVLFNYLGTKNIPIVWTLHDCWAFTGHCTYFDSVGCQKWKIQCEKCPKKSFYPTSYLIDNSKKNYLDKKKLFSKVANGIVITPSQWLKNLAEESFLKYPVTNIYNGIDLQVFKPQLDVRLIKEKHQITTEKIILGVASIWDERKGLNDFIALQKIVSNSQILLVGLSEKQIKQLPTGIIGIKRTENIEELAALYALAEVFVNPTYQDNFPTTNLEALACGTPVITYNTGGSPEAIDELTGKIVPKGNIHALSEAIEEVLNNGKSFYTKACRLRAENRFNKEDRYMDYLVIFEKIVQEKLNLETKQ
jgi:putative colanic acid biosynthesis glycosyltransferase